MIIISHRVNSIKGLLDTKKSYGVEVDIRSKSSELIIHHDPFQDGEKFLEWLKYFSHKFLILNVKEEGLESALIDCMKKNNIVNYFS